MIILKESAGDIKLGKAVGIFCDKIPKVQESDYHDQIGAYIIFDEYTFNIPTQKIEDATWTEHYTILARQNIELVKQVTRDSLFLCTIYDKSSDFETKERTLSIRTYSHQVDKEVKDYLMKLFKRYNPIGIHMENWGLDMPLGMGQGAREHPERYS